MELGSLGPGVVSVVEKRQAYSSDRTSSSRRDTVMTASNSPRTGTTSIDETALHLLVNPPSQIPTWPYTRDEPWATFEPPRRMTSDNQRAELQRGSSAPSTLFEECLPDFHSEEMIMPKSRDPFGDGECNDLLAWAEQNLVPIVERGGSQPMEITGVREAADSSCSQRFLVAQAGFERRISSISAPTQMAEPAHVGGYGAVPAMGKNIGPSFDSQMASMIGASEEIYGGGNSSTVPSTYSVAPDQQIPYPLGSELRPGGSDLWNSSAAPGITFEGNRLLGGLGTNEPPSGWLHGPAINVAADRAATTLPSPGLIRHSSLPANYVPGRANRGHATHPRSVAERVRRGKISERMKRLQDLVPNMERQSNTADMLDEVVEYVKQLKLKVEELSLTVVQLKERAMHPD